MVRRKGVRIIRVNTVFKSGQAAQPAVLVELFDVCQYITPQSSAEGFGETIRMKGINI